MTRRACSLTLLLGVLTLSHHPVRAERPRIGPFTLGTADGEWSMNVGLAAQLRYQLDANGLGDDDGDVDSLVQARRIRPTLRGSMLTRDLGYYLHLSTAPGSIELMDLYVDYAFHSSLRARAGQWKIPFTRFRTGSFQNLTLVDWPVTTTYFGAERQMGLALHNGYERTPRGLQYEAGVFTGVNARAAHSVGLPVLFGEKAGNPSDLADPAPRADLHPELVAHLAYNLGEIDTSTDTDWKGGPMRLSAGVSAAWDLDPGRHADLALRLAPEVVVKLRHLSMSGVFYVGLVSTGDGINDQGLGVLGVVFQTSYLFLRRLELALRYATVQIDEDVLLDARSRARGLVAAEADPIKQKALEQQYLAAGTVQREHETTLGLNVYLIGASLKAQTDLSWLAHDTTSGRKHDVRLRVQLQLVF